VTDAKLTSTSRCSGCREQSEVDPGRRRLLQAGAAVTLGLLPQGLRAESDDPKRMMRPQVGDLLVRSEGDQEGTLIAVADVKVGDAPVIAWAVDPATKLPRDGSRLNQVLLQRFDPSSLGDATRPHAADGLVAYSAICTHAQCTVTDWVQDRQILQCPCHQSEYDPRHDAKVVGGPAPRALAALPLKIADGKPQVAAGFIGKVGMDQQMM
jgi:rieske iron-sulfur protein